MKIGPADSGGRPQKPDDEERRKEDITPKETPGTDSANNAERLQEAGLLTEKTSQDADEAAPADESGEADENAEIENRADKIEQAKQRMESGYYNSPEVKEEIAKRITDDFTG